MVVVFSSTGFFLHNCDELTFESQLDRTPLYGLPSGMPNKNLTGWLFCTPESLEIIIKLGIETCYIDIDGNSKNYMKRNVSDCVDLMSTMFKKSSVEESQEIVDDYASKK